MEPWWHRYPEAFETEKTSLDALGYPWQIDQAAFAAGRLVIALEVPGHAGGAMKLTAEYPDTYPYFPPCVFADHLIFSRHQHPVGKNLCLLAREGEQWSPGKDTLALLLRDQLPKIQEVNAVDTSSELVAANEDHVGEPLSSFLSYPPNSVLIVPDGQPPAEFQAGRLSVKCRTIDGGAPEAVTVNGIVHAFWDLHRQPLVTLPVSPPGFSQSLDGHWMRLPKRPAFNGESTLLNELVTAMRQAVPTFARSVKAARRGQILIAGFVYEDELGWRQQSHDWLFVALRIEREEKGARPARIKLNFLRTDWGGEDAWMRRAPAIRPLRKKTALVIGQGSLGSSVTLHLARAGLGRLHLIDSDYLQIGNTVRWALGWRYAGCGKAGALADHLRNEYPYTEVHAHDMRVGMPGRPNEQWFSDYELMHSLAGQVNVIVDASASHRVSHFLSDLARELGKPYVWLTTTHGCVGGIVGRVIPGSGKGCWHCFLHGLADGTIRQPADSEGAEIQPGGCSQPTFVGAGIDSDEIALLGARLTIATLCKGEEGGYPDFGWNVAIADLQRAGLSIAPEWTRYPLDVNIACPACKAK